MVAPSKEFIMSDQEFINTYVRILNESLKETVSKNMLLQAQFEVSKRAADRAAEFERKIKELTGVSLDNETLVQELFNKNSHVDTFKRELLEARNQIKLLIAENDSLRRELFAIKNPDGVLNDEDLLLISTDEDDLQVSSSDTF